MSKTEKFIIGSFQEELVVFIEKSVAKTIKKKLGGLGFITQIDEVSPEPVHKVDTFRIVLYHPSLKEYIEKKTNRDDWKKVK